MSSFIILAIYLTIGMLVGYALIDFFHMFESGMLDDEDTDLINNAFVVATARKVSLDPKTQKKTIRRFVLGWPIIWFKAGLMTLPVTISSY